MVFQDQSILQNYNIFSKTTKMLCIVKTGPKMLSFLKESNRLLLQSSIGDSF
jgi:hypothetical protein